MTTNQLEQTITQIDSEIEVLQQRRQLLIERRRAGQSYRDELRNYSILDLIKEARAYDAWLSAKCKTAGEGAFADSGEAKICALLDTMATRLEIFG